MTFFVSARGTVPAIILALTARALSASLPLFLGGFLMLGISVVGQRLVEVETRGGVAL